MRPIDKGNTPLVNTELKSVTDYKDWRQDLIDRLGNYCCYCNMTLNDSPQVEHVAPKNSVPELLLEWNNMLLACGPCNRAKSDNDYTVDDHYIPDYHNTHLAFDYIVVPHPRKNNTPACVPIPSANRNADIRKANNTIALLKLDALTSGARATDLRWKYRYEAFLSATLWRQSWDDWGNTMADKFIPLLKDAALAKGFFSIWFSFFQEVATIKAVLINSFPGTRVTAFDLNSNPIPLHDLDI